MRVRVNKDGVFRITLPKYSHDALAMKEVTSDTQSGAVHKFDKLRVIYGNMLNKDDRVIAYQFSINRKRERHTGKDERYDMAFSTGAGVVLGVANYRRTSHCDADGKHMRYSYDQENNQPYPREFQYSKFSHCIARDGTTIEWTQEREVFFTRLCDALLIIATKLESLDEKESLLEHKVSGQLLIGSNK